MVDRVTTAPNSVHFSGLGEGETVLGDYETLSGS